MNTSHRPPATSVLLRHEALRTRGPLGVIVLGATMFGIVGALMAWTRLPVIEQFGIGLGMLAAGALVPVLMIVLTVDYWRSAYGRLGYFTQTLPVRGSRIYGARLVYGSLVCVAAALWSVLLGALATIGSARAAAAPGQGGLDLLVTRMRDLTDRVGVIWWFVFAAIGVLFIVSYLAQYYFAASIGSEGRLGTLGPAGPVLLWFAVYLLMQLVNVIGLFALPFGIGMTGGSMGFVEMDLWGAALSGSAVPDGMPLGFLAPFVLVSALMAVRTAYSWNHRVSLR